MKCPNCGTENRFNAIICDACGNSLLEAPTDEPIDLDRFDRYAPPHSDPAEAAPLNSADSRDDADGEKNDGVDFSEIPAKIGGFFKSIFCAVGRGISAAADWVTEKARWIARKFDDGDGKLEDDEKFRKTVLAVILGVAVIIIVLLLSFCGACSGCSSCGPESLSGTWVEASNLKDGYHEMDYILEMNADGTLSVKGMQVGTYTLSEGMLNMSFNGMEYTCLAEAGDEQLTASLCGYSSVLLELVKISDETGLTADELAGLYPDE